MRVLLCVILGFTTGFVISSTNNKKLFENQKSLIAYTNNYNSKVKIIGQILDNYGQGQISNTYILKVVKLDNKNLKGDINILGTINNKIKLGKGDIIEFDVKLRGIDNFNSFEYDNYLLMKDIYAQTNIYNITKKGNSISYLSKLIENTRQEALGVINKIYPGDSAKLLTGIFLGIKGDFSKELKNNFSNSGLSHIVTVSGYNITVIIVFISVFLGFLPQKIKSVIITALVFFFIMLIGNNLPALRAGITGIIGYIVITYGRKINLFSVLLLVITIFVMYNPLIINYDVGFHLSLMALTGLITIEKPINNSLKFLPNFLKIRESLSTTLAVIIFTIPIVLINFGKISIISIVTNILVLPIIPINMLLGGLSIVGYYINTKLGIIIGYLSYLSLKYVLILVGFFGRLSISTIEIDLTCYKEIFFILYYFVLIFIILIMKSRKINTK